MKTLFIIRHAKSSWKDTSLEDFQRPLNKRGLRNAPEMGERLAVKGFLPEMMVSSHAIRAYRTASMIAEKIHYLKEDIVVDQRLYHASSSEILTLVKDFSNEYKSIAIFGHNPGFMDFANRFSTKTIVKLPTCAIVIVKFSVLAWDQIDRDSVLEVEFDFPKNKIKSTF